MGTEYSAVDLLHQRNAEVREWRKDDWNPGPCTAEVMKVDLHALGRTQLAATGD